MDFSSLETWLDILVILIALISLGVALYLALRLMKRESGKNSTPADVTPSKIPESPVLSKQKSSSKGKKTVFDQISANPTPPKSVSKPVFDQLSQSPASSNGFMADQLRLESGSRLVLALKNTGPKVIFKRVSAGPNNEVTITHVKEAQPTNSLLPEYPQDSSISFHLEADNVIGRTFQFTLYYGDLQGNLYRQDVSGLGKEYPIIDPVVKIA